MKPPATILWLTAAVMAVLWAIVVSVFPPMMVLAFGRGGSPVRFWALFVIQVVVAALVCAYSYREGWKRGREDQSQLQAGGRDQRRVA